MFSSAQRDRLKPLIWLTPTSRFRFRVAASASPRRATSAVRIFTFWPFFSRLTPAVTMVWPGFTPPVSSTSLPDTPPTCTGCRRTGSIPFSITHTALAPLFCTSADSGARSCPPAPRPGAPAATTAVIPSRTSSLAGIDTLTV
jgi:hypothetical protein